MRKRRKIALLIATLFVLANIQSSTIANSNEIKGPISFSAVKNDPSKANIYFGMTPSEFLKPNYSYIMDGNGPSAGTKTYQALLPLCEFDKNSACLLSVEASSDNGKTWEQPISNQEVHIAYSGIPTKLPPGAMYPVATNWDYDPGFGAPSGANNRIFKFAKAQHTGGNEFIAEAVVTGMSNFSKSPYFDPVSLKLNIIPIKTMPKASNQDPDANCGSWKETCFTAYNFDKAIKFRIKINFRANLWSSFSGWFQGRTIDTVFSNDKDALVYSFEGYPITTEQVLATMEPSDKLVDLMNSKYGFNLNSRSFNFVTSNEFKNTMNLWQDYLEKIPKRSAHDYTIWTISSAGSTWFSNVHTEFNGCLNNKHGVLGTVSSNATVFGSAAPIWNPEDSSLTYQVGSTELDSEGRKNVGYYDLIIREDIAKCLWGEVLNNANASISVVNGDGSSQVVTTTFTNSNGWVKFRAAGFHFSSPRILVKLVKPAPKTGLKIISCKKGKTIKKISGVNPVCPIGYLKSI
jgi:hypothetical protein